MEKNIIYLNNFYKNKKKEILSRLKDFESVDIKNKRNIFPEICFCLLTPQSKAKTCWNAVSELKKTGVLFTGTSDKIQKYLTGVRFYKNKSSYIIHARKYLPEIMEVLNNGNSPEILREYLVKNIKGLGYKEASHFLRNIGLGNRLAILDRHILKNLLKYNVISTVPKTLTKKTYLDIERKMLAFSKEIKIPLDHLDLVFWSMQTGEIFK